MRTSVLMLAFLLVSEFAVASTRKTAELHGSVEGASYKSFDGKLSLTYPAGDLIDGRNPKRLRIEIEDRVAENAHAIEFGAEGDRFLRRKFSVQMFRKDGYPGDSVALLHVLQIQVDRFRKQEGGREAVLSALEEQDLGKWPARRASLTFPKRDRIFHFIVFSQTSYVVVVIGEWAEIPFQNDSGELKFNEKYRDETLEMSEGLASSIDTKADRVARDNAAQHPS
jgi:hypothetical protein